MEQNEEKKLTTENTSRPAIKSRVFEVVQREEYLNYEMIQRGLAHTTIKEYAFIKHDKDEYTEEELRKDKNLVKGNCKPAHWHVVCKADTQLSFDVIAKWFGVEEQYIQKKRGRNAFIESVRYLTHEDEVQQAKGKYLYPDNEVYANFDFRQKITQYLLRKDQGNMKDRLDEWRVDIMHGRRSLKSCRNEDDLLYAIKKDELRKLRLDYLEHEAQLPAQRTNFYVTGGGGFGKGVVSKALACSLFPDIEDEDEIFFIVGANGVTFDGYDGQPVIIWEDFRAADLINVLGGRGNVFEIFDTHPKNKVQNIKYGKTRLINAVNIVNSVQPYEEFLDGLAGEYTDRYGVFRNAEDKGQSYRRFPFIIEVTLDNFVLLANCGLLNEYEYTRYMPVVMTEARVRALYLKYGNDPKKIKEIEADVMRGAVSKIKEITQKDDTIIDAEEDDLLQFNTIDLTKNEPTQHVKENCTMDIPDDVAIELNRSEE